VGASYWLARSLGVLEPRTRVGELPAADL